MAEEMHTMNPDTEEGSISTPEHECGTIGCTGQCATSGSSDAGNEQEYETASLAVLLALVPLLVFTLFGQIGFF